MKKGDIIFSIRCCGGVALLFAVMAVLFAPSPVQAGACMDGKLTAAIDYGLNDSATKTVKKSPLTTQSKSSLTSSQK